MKDLVTFTDKYKSAQAQGYNWKLMDDTIFELCQRYPGHTDAREVMAKVGLVNRAYRANVQMGTKDAEWKLAQHLLTSEIDAHLSNLRGLPSFDEAAVPVVLKAHQSLVAVCREITGRKELSFASKYLSFHAPRVVPIYDSYSYAEGRRTTRGRVGSAPPGDAATEYRTHTASLLFLANHLRTQGIAPDAKLIDVVLYVQAGGTG